MTDDNTRELPFVVGNDADPDKAKRVLEGLKRMAELGKKAEEALAALERDGRYDHVVVWVEGEDHSMHLNRNKLPAYKPISIEDAPMMAGLSLVLGSGTKTRYGGHECSEHPLYLRGECIVFYRGSGPRIEQMGEQCQVGTLQVSKRAVLYMTSRCGAAYLVTERKASTEAMLAHIAKCSARYFLASECALHLVRTPKYKTSLDQKHTDLRGAIPNWLVEGGHVVRLLEDAVRAVWIDNVMEI